MKKTGIQSGNTENSVFLIKIAIGNKLHWTKVKLS